MVIKSKKFLLIIFGIIILIFYMNFTRSISINSLVDTKNISLINIIKQGDDSSSSKNITIKNKNEIKNFLVILKDYKYKRVIKITNPNAADINASDSKLDIIIQYSDKKEQLNAVDFIIDSDNKIKINYSDYKLKGKDQKLYERLQYYFDNK